MNKLTMDDVLYFQKRVVEWNKLFGNEVDDTSLVPTYRKLTLEEAGKNELQKAIAEGDLVEQCDAICDLWFTAGFWWVLSGHSLNGRDDVNFVKRSFSEEFSEKEFQRNARNLLSYAELDNVWIVQTYLVQLTGQAQHKFDIRGAMERVIESNFSKAVSKKLNIDIEKEIEYITSQGRYGDIFTEEVGDYILFKARKDIQEGFDYPTGKIIKSSSFLSVEALGGLGEFIYD